MKHCGKRVVAFLAAMLMTISLIQHEGSAALKGVYFTAVNDQLLVLSSETMPFWVGGTLYICNTVFIGTDLGVRYVRNYSMGLAMLYTSSKDLRFDLVNQTVYDKDGEKYAGAAIEKNGYVFFPIDLVCKHFGLKWSLNSTATVPLVRIKSDHVVLNDRSFLNAAATMMASRYAEYEKLVNSSQENTPPEVDPDVGNTTDPDPTPEKDPTVDQGQNPTPDPGEEQGKTPDKEPDTEPEKEPEQETDKEPDQEQPGKQPEPSDGSGTDNEPKPGKDQTSNQDTGTDKEQTPNQKQEPDNEQGEDPSENTGNDEEPVEEDPPILAAAGQKVYLVLSGTSTDGLRDSMEMLGESSATFLLTVQQMEDGDLVRALLGNGHGIALAVQSETEEELLAELQQARKLVWMASCSLLQLVWYDGGEDISALMEEQGCVWMSAAIDRRSKELCTEEQVGELMSLVGEHREDIGVYLGDDENCADGLSELLRRLSEAQYRLCAWRLTA